MCAGVEWSGRLHVGYRAWDWVISSRAEAELNRTEWYRLEDVWFALYRSLVGLILGVGGGAEVGMILCISGSQNMPLGLSSSVQS